MFHTDETLLALAYTLTSRLPAPIGAAHVHAYTSFAWARVRSSAARRSALRERAHELLSVARHTRRCGHAPNAPLACLRRPPARFPAHLHMRRRSQSTPAPVRRAEEVRMPRVPVFTDRPAAAHMDGTGAVDGGSLYMLAAGWAGMINRCDAHVRWHG